MPHHVRYSRVSSRARRTMTRAVFIRSACIALAGAIVAGAVVHSAPSSSGRSTRTCTSSDLKIRMVHSAVAAGTVGGYVGFTNRARAACRLSGWPTLVAISAEGSSTTAVHRRSTMFGPRPIRGVPVLTLRHGERADAVFTASDHPRPGKTTCPPPYRHLRVTPPGARGAFCCLPGFPRWTLFCQRAPTYR